MGLSVVVLKSIDRQGRSGIVSRLPPAWVSTPGRNVDVVVTEWGVADLRGLSEHGRALAIANVASPLLRRQLLTGWDAGR
jgi:acetyl-CoA hydrolase